jgi:hypothetical protein
VSAVVYRISIAIASISGQFTFANLLWRALTPDAFQLVPNETVASLLSGHPWTNLPRRIVPNVLRVSAVEIRDPMMLVVLMEADDPTGFSALLHHRRQYAPRLA